MEFAWQRQPQEVSFLDGGYFVSPLFTRISLAGRVAVQIRLRAEIRVEEFAMTQPSGRPVNLLPENSPQSIFQFIGEKAVQYLGHSFVKVLHAAKFN